MWQIQWPQVIWYFQCSADCWNQTRDAFITKQEHQPSDHRHHDQKSSDLFKSFSSSRPRCSGFGFGFIEIGFEPMIPKNLGFVSFVAAEKKTSRHEMEFIIDFKLDSWTCLRRSNVRCEHRLIRIGFQGDAASTPCFSLAWNGSFGQTIRKTFCRICAYYACFAPSCADKHEFFVEEKSVVLHLLEGPDQGHTSEG